MKKNLLHKIIFAGSLFITLSAQSQSDNLAYAITDSVRNGVKWNFLRTVNMQTGDYSHILLRLLNNSELQLPPNTPPVISCNGVAAIAYDKTNKRLYYTPMLTDRLSYVDLKTMKIHVVTNRFTGLMPKANDQSNIITRMVIGDDNKGYALTSDGKHLFRFRTKSNPDITDLGSLVDARSNHQVSIHNGCSSFGGDIIADDDDNLYLFTFGKNVFRIDIHTKVAKHLGAITGLPDNFTGSGAAVDKSGKNVILVSSSDTAGIYSLNLQTLAAMRLPLNRSWFTSDLANGNVLKKRNTHRLSDDLIVMDNEDQGNIQLYPNPVTAKEFKINFSDVKAGTYSVRVTDVEGKSILTKIVTTSGKNSTVTVNLPGVITSGIYLVRVTDAHNKTSYSGKIFVQ